MDAVRWLLLVFFCSSQLCEANYLETDECTFGVRVDTSSNHVINTYSSGMIYLNMENPAICTGYVHNITFCYLKPMTGAKLNTGSFSIWEPVDEDTDSYKQIEASNGILEFKNVGCKTSKALEVVDYDNIDENEAQQLVCRAMCFDNPILVQPGYVMGLELITNDTENAGAIGERMGQDVGLCVASSKSLGVEDNSVQFNCDNSSLLVNRTLLLEATITTPCYPLDTANVTINDNLGNVSFSCKDNFKLSFPLILTCSENGWTINVNVSWNGEYPTCVLTNCTYVQTVDSHLTIIGDVKFSDVNSFTNGSAISFECDEDYHLDGASTESLQCLEGLWSSEFPRCILNTCNLPENPENGLLLHHRYRRYRPVSINTTIFFECDNGYSLTYDWPLICLSNGTWNASVPECIQNKHTSSAVNTSVGSTDAEQVELEDGYRFLIVAVISSIFVVLFVVVCVLMVLLVKKRSKLNERITTSNSTSALNEKLLEDRDKELCSLTYHIDPYATINTPNEICITTQNGMAYVRRTPVCYSPHSNSSVISSIPRSLMSSRPVSPQQMTRLSPMSCSQLVPFYEVSPNALDDLEQSLKSENVYWTPADAEEELHVQLDTIKVKAIPSKNLRVLEEIGSGQYATVHRGILIADDNVEEINAAVKVPSDMLHSQEDKIRFLQEAAVMGQFNHSNVLKLLGVVVDQPEKIMIVAEFVEKGDLLSYLEKLRSTMEKKRLPFKLLNFSRQICLGMSYLSGKGYIHRDLAARNILVSKDDICKIADFGMSRGLEDESYYFVHEGAVIPVKWTAPEAIRDKKYSKASDIWSYGCVLYEIWSLGHKPFKNTTIPNTLKILKTGQRLTPPPGCPREIYKIMIATWHPLPNKRPSFNDMMLSLLKSDDDMVLIPDEDGQSTHPNANELGADLQAGIHMYKDLQKTYLSTM